MKKLWVRDHEGQVLVWVAVMTVILLALVSVAVDGGYVYAQRRLMQNAADAGALAGAWENCYGTPANAASTAHQYAEVRNRADPTMTNVEAVSANRTVTVTAGFRAQTIFARVIGLNSVDVYARAAAKCGPANSPCGLWPIGYNVDQWHDLSCGKKFILWDDEQQFPIDDCGVLNGWDCDIDNNGTQDAPLHGRTWLDFSAVTVGGALDSCEHTGCGSNELRWRIDGSSPDGFCRSTIKIPSCTVGDSGVINSGWDEVETQVGQYKKVPLYSGHPGDCTPNCVGLSGSACCGVTGYNVVDVGCLHVDAVWHLCPFDPLDAGHTYPAPQSAHCNGPRVIVTSVGCDVPECTTTCGGIGDGELNPWDIKAVGLIQ